MRAGLAGCPKLRSSVSPSRDLGGHFKTGGITFAQDEKSAKYDGMPRSARAAGCVDFVLPPERIARELGRIGRHGYVIGPKAEEDVARRIPEGETGLPTIFSMLLKATGVDFSDYRQTTISRRVQRRMVVYKMEALRGPWFLT